MQMSDPSRHTDALPTGERASLRLKLVVVEGKDRGRELVLAPGIYRLGTAEGNELVLGDSAISRGHLEVQVLDHGLRMTDQGSRNGSFCDGKRFSMIEVGPGALIQLGRTCIQVALAEDPSPRLPASSAESFGALRGCSVRMREVFAQLERAARSDHDILIHGETGTGKQLSVEALHANSSRAKGPLIVCDLSSLAPTLLESELFGHRRGAFTGADSNRAGAFEQAHGGTLFLDEIAELGLEGQPRLLRALEERQVKRLGETTFRSVDVRVVAATHKDLQEEVAAGRFRADLYYRLGELTISLPPLRERKEDIPFLVSGMVAAHPNAPPISPELMGLLCEYEWPGNVRQLRNVIQLLLTLGPHAVLPLLHPAWGETRASAASDTLGPQRFAEAKEQTIHLFEKLYVQDLMQRSGGNISQAARVAGMDRTYLHRLLKKHGLDR